MLICFFFLSSAVIPLHTYISRLALTGQRDQVEIENLKRPQSRSYRIRWERGRGRGSKNDTSPLKRGGGRLEDLPMIGSHHHSSLVDRHHFPTRLPHLACS